MINGLGVLGWGVGGIEAEAAMLGQPVSMLIPEVVGFKLTGALNEGVTATDLVLTVTQMLRAKGVVGRFVEFFGPGLASLTLADRATIANMAPEYGATCGFFAIDDKTLDYMRLTGRPTRRSRWSRPMPRSRASGATRTRPIRSSPTRSSSTWAPWWPSLAGPKRPQDRVALAEVDEVFNGDLAKLYKKDGPVRVAVEGRDHDIGDGDVVIAAITSCTNTSNPSVLVAAGLVARKARAAGPQAQALGQDQPRAGIAGRHRLSRQGGADRGSRRDRLQPRRLWLHHLHRQFGPAAPAISAAINDNDIVAASVLSGNRNFEGRVSPDVRANFLASPPLVVAYALKGTVTEDIIDTPIGQGSDGEDVFLKDIWPTNARDRRGDGREHRRAMFQARYANVYKGDAHWRASRSRARTPISGARARPMSPTRPISRA